MKQDSSLQFVAYKMIYMDFCRYIAKTNGYLDRNIEKNQIVVVWLRQFNFFQMRGDCQIVRPGVLSHPEDQARACGVSQKDVDYMAQAFLPECFFFEKPVKG